METASGKVDTVPTRGPFWPVVEHTRGRVTTVVDSFVLTFFLDREKCNDPRPAVDALNHVLAGIGREQFQFYVDEEGDRRPMPDDPAYVLHEYVVEPTGRGEVVDLRLRGGQQSGNRWQVRYLHHPDVAPGEWPGEKSWISLHIPQDTFLQEGADSILDVARRLSEILPYAYGYGNPALAYGQFFRDAVPFTRRHPGFDVASPLAAAFDIDDHALGAYWINLFGPRLSAALGGAEALRGSLPDEARVFPWPSGGTCVVLGDAPDVGDVNRGNNLPLYRRLARVLRPHMRVPEILYFQDEDGMADREAQAAWHRRFLDT
jgi:hypothetical protein